MVDVLPPDEMLYGEVGAVKQEPSFVSSVLSDDAPPDNILFGQDVSDDYKEMAGLDDESRYIKQQAMSLDGFAQYIGDQWALGVQDVQDGMFYSHALQSGEKYEEVEEKLAGARARTAALEKKVSLFEDQVFYSNQQNPVARFVQEIPGAVARSAAFTGAVVGGGATVGAGTAAATLNPVGFGVGFGVGAFSTAGMIATGLSYRELRKKQISHGTSVTLAVSSGLIQAVIENLQLRQLKTLGKKAYDAAIKSPEFKSAVRGVIMRFTKDVGVQGLEEGSQELTQVTAEMVGVFTDLKRLPTTEELKEASVRVTESIKGGLQAGVGFTVGAKAVGKVTGTLVKIARGQGTVEDGLVAVAQELKDQQKTDPLSGYVEVLDESEETADEKTESKKPKTESVDAVIQEAAEEVEQELSRLKRTEALKELRTLSGKVEADLKDTQSKLNRRYEENKQDIRAGKNADIVERRNPTKGLENKFGRLEQERDDLNLLKWGLENDVMTSDEIRKLNTETPGRRLNALADFAIKRIIRSGKKIQQLTRKNVKANQKYLKQLIGRSGLKPADQAKFMNVILKGDFDEIESIQNEVDRLLEKRARKTAQDRLKNILSETGKKEVSGLEKGTVPIEVQSILNTYRQLLKRDPNEVMNFADEIASKDSNEVEPGGLTTDMLKIVLSDIMNVYTGTSADINAVAKKLETIFKTGKDERLAQLDKEKAKLQKQTAAVVKGIRGEKPRAKLEALNGILRYIVETKRTGFTRGWFNTHTANVATVLQHTPDTNDQSYKLLDLGKEDRERTANTSKFTKQMFDALTDNGKGKRDKKLVSTIIQGTRKKKRAGFKDFISDNELIQLWMQTQDKRLHDGLVSTYHRPVEKLQAQIESILSDDQLMLAERLQDFYQEYYERINEKHIDMFGYPLRQNKNYSGRASRIGADPAVSNDFLESLRHNKSVVPASLRVSKGGKLQLKTSDAFDNAMQHISAMESWRSMAEKAKAFEFYFAADSAATKQIIQKFGEDWFRRFQRSYRKVIGLERTPYKMKYVDAVRGNYGMFITGNPMQYIKQATGILIYLNYLSPVRLLSGINDYIDNFESASRRLDATNFMIQRHNNATPEVRAAMKGLSNDLGGKVTLSAIMSAPVSQADYVVNSFGMWAVYKDGLRRGLSESEAMEAAERAADESQSSALASQKTTLELEAGSLGQLISTLSKQNTQISNLESAAWRRFISNPNFETGKKALQASIAFRASQAAFGAAGAATAIATGALMSDDDDGESLDEALYNAVTDFVDNLVGGGHLGLPVIGASMKAAMTARHNWQFDANRKIWEPAVPMVDALFEMNLLMIEFMKDGTSSVPLDEVDYLRFWHEWNRSGAVLLPAQARVLISLDPAVRLALWLLTDPEYEKEKKRMRKRGDSFEPLPQQEETEDDN